VRSVGAGVFEFENAQNSSSVLTISNRVQQGNGERAVFSARTGAANQRMTVSLWNKGYTLYNTRVVVV
jgi:hypothetical protein